MYIVKIKKACLDNYILLILLAILSLDLLVSQVNAEWQSLYYRDHPLVGKIFYTQDKTWISVKELSANIRNEQIILLGETHTNPDHHVGQAGIIENWLSTEIKSALVFEMLAYDDWKQFLNPEFTLEQLHQTLEEDSGRWDWELYAPILEVQIKHQLPIVGANLTRTQLDEYSSGELCNITRDKYTIELCDLFSSEEESIIQQLIFDAHCGYLPLEHTQPLLRIQVAKDASFALSLANIASTHKVALIAGAVHVRKDIGVPVHLQSMGKQSVSIAFLNVDPDKMQVEQYIDQADLNQQFDYLYFTPSERNQDPCVEFAEQLKKMKKLTK
ncbi:MAG: ChaN family lipoprotein [Gammaproteobacteria bacterium]|nr:ChaN family lipoprotein [Gammaproteobacteria bacterium]